MKTILLLLFPITMFSQDSLKQKVSVLKTYNTIGQEIPTDSLVTGVLIDLMSDGTIRKRIILSK